MDFIQLTIDMLAHPCPICLGSLYYCSPEKVVILTRRDDYEPHYVDDRKYFELATFYGEFARDWTERRPPMEYEPRDAAIDVYREWQQQNAGNRHVPTPPPLLSRTAS